jgi:hypothetical protein
MRRYRAVSKTLAGTRVTLVRHHRKHPDSGMDRQ